jgi:hypothetical protein
MLLPLDEIKRLLGIDSSVVIHDEALTTAGEVITRQMELYCGRGLELQIGVIEEHPITSRKIYLHRFPIQTLIVSVYSGALASTDYVQNEAEGWVEFNNCYYYYPAGGYVICEGDLGYPPEEVPPDLADAFARACGTKSGYGTGTAAGAGASAPIKNLGLGQGAITIGFDTSTQLGYSGAYDASNAPLSLQPYADVLDYYRRFWP